MPFQLMMETVINYSKLEAKLKSIESNWRYECFFLRAVSPRFSLVVSFISHRLSKVQILINRCAFLTDDKDDDELFKNEKRIEIN